jgi:hypothetical protein
MSVFSVARHRSAQNALKAPSLVISLRGDVMTMAAAESRLPENLNWGYPRNRLNDRGRSKIGTNPFHLVKN